MVHKRKTQLPGARDLSSEPDGAAGAQTSAEQQQTQQQPLARQQPQPPRQQAGYQGQGGSGYAHRGRPLQGRGVVAPQQQAPRGIAPPQRGAGSGPVYAPTPELHQATDAPQQPRVTMQPVRAESSSTSSSNQPVHEAMAQLKPPSAAQQEESVVHAATALSKALTPPLRPGKGVLGKRCIVKANHFFVELSKKDLHHYDVTITPEGTSCRVKRAVIAKLVEQYKESLGGCVPAYDGFKHLYTAGALPFVSREFQIKLLYESGERGFAVAIKFVACLDLRHLKLFLQGTHPDATGGVIQSLNTVLRQLPTNPYIAVGRSFYSPKSSQTQPLGGGLEAWRGFYQSVRPTQMGLSLNIDICAAAFIEPVCVIEFVSQLLNKTATARPLSNSDCAKIEEALRGILIEVTHRANRRKHRVRGLTSRPTRELDFPVDGGRKSVVDYFLEKHDIMIEHVQWPCLDVGNSQRPNYLPMEVCNIVAGQKYSMMLNKAQISRFLTVTCQRPQVRERDIKTVCDIFEDDPCAKEFGIEINSELTSVEARRLVPPLLKYHDTGREKVCSPQMGVWNMRNKKLVNGGRVDNWISLCFDPNVSDNTAGAFYHALTKVCNSLGMDFNPYPVLPAYRGSPSRSEEVLKSRFLEASKKLQPQKKELDLLICILPDNNGDLYGDLKRICETDLGIVSQCCLTTHVFRMNAQYLTNVALKINVKVGGRNTVLDNAISMRIPNVGNVPTIIFGADVTHPHRGDHSPSIAAVVASQDWPEITKYAGLVCAQQPRLELIQDLYKESQGANGQKVSGGMIRELLISFYKATGHKPERIIFYRDGVGEREFYKVLLFELDAIRKACNSLETDYQPRVTFVVVQKRNNTKLFADNHSDPDATDKSGNILPGTVVDSKICHPREFDFYLCSHAGVRGTSRPVHYHVLWDENKFQADALQSLTNNLCYTYARCTRSVSIVPPVYYAHLAAFRARFYVNTEPETSLGANAAVRPLPPLKENVKRVMFYC